MLKIVRRILAVAFWLGITFLFIDISGIGQQWFGWMAKAQFLPNIMQMDFVVIALLVILTLLFGRIYCSVICPTGVLQDVFAWIGRRKIFRKNKRAKYANKYSYSKPKTWLRVAVLVVFVTMLIAGFSAGVSLLAPYSAYGRMVSALIQPLYICLNNALAQWSEANDNYMFYTVEMHAVPTVLLYVAAISALILFILAFRGGRTYCNTICPVGTVLGYIAKFSWLKIHIAEDQCIKCGMCAKNCKAACINIEKGKPATIDYTRCVVCGDCQTVCSEKGINLMHIAKANCTVADDAPASVSRRNFIAIGASMLTAATLKAQEKTTDGGLAIIEDKKIPNRKTKLTPPGSLSARNLQQHCTACQLCIAKCPNGVLRPSQDLSTFLQPEMQYDKGYCRPECTRCSELCPAGAIRPISVEHKTAIQIGHAVWIKDNCIPLTDGVKCGNCAAHCPSGAIQMIPNDKSYKWDVEREKWVDDMGNVLNPNDTTMIPSVNTEKCIGCGACEYLCPARPFSAIYVEGHEVHREI